MHFSTSLVGVVLALGLGGVAMAQTPAVTKVDLDQAIQLALQNSPSLAAARAQIPQSLAEETTAAIRPNPVVNWDGLFLPVFTPHDFSGTYLNQTAEFDASLAYTIERGGKRRARIQAARDATAVTRAQVNDSARGLSFNVAQQFINVLLAKSSLDFSQQDLASWQHTVNLSQTQFTDGALSGGDFDTIKLQTLQFETTVSGARLGLAQALEALRQQVGFISLPPDYDVAGELVFVPVTTTLADLQTLALKNRPDLAAADLGITAAQSQYKLAQADGKRDLTATGQLSHVGGIVNGGALFSIEVPIFDRNQGEIARTAAAETQAKDQDQAAREQVMTDVATAYSALDEGRKVIEMYTSGYRDQAKQVLDIRQYSYQHGGASLLDLLDAERTYRQTELGYRQALATYMLALEQLKEAVGTRNLP